MQWVYDDIDKFWLTGTPEEGCGVYQQSNDKLWMANVSYKRKLEKELGPFKTKEKAMEEAEKALGVARLSDVPYFTIPYI